MLKSIGIALNFGLGMIAFFVRYITTSNYERMEDDRFFPFLDMVRI